VLFRNHHTIYNPDMDIRPTGMVLVLQLSMSLMAGCAPASTPEPTPQDAPAVPTFTPLPAPPTATTLPGATATVPEDDCINDAVFVEDVTIPDFSLAEPGETLDKRWLIQNSGTCDWDAGYRLVRLGVDDFVGPSELALFPAAAGSSAELRVELTAPDEPGEYISRWQAYSEDGVPFGQEIYLLIVVPTPTPEPTATERPD
jgi:hypothetical protein